MIYAARYRRVSSESQEDNSSLQTQLERMDAYCAAHGYLTSDDTLYTDVDTGIVWRDRTRLQDMLTDAQRGKFSVVVIDHPDRIGRGDPVIIIMEELSYYNIRLESVQVKIEDTDEGRLLIYLESYASKKEHSRILKRTGDGRLARVVRDHKGMGNSPCYGYQWDDPSPKAKNCYVYNDSVMHTDQEGIAWTERKVVAYCFQKAKEGMPCRKIAEELNRRGIPTRKAGEWSTRAVATILENPMYQEPLADPDEQEIVDSIRQLAGKGQSISDIAKYLNEEEVPAIIPTIWRGSTIGRMLKKTVYMGKFYSFRQTYTRRGKRFSVKQKPLEEQVLMPEGFAPPIVDEETFAIVQRQLSYNQKYSTRNLKHPEQTLLIGSLAPVCGHCGRRMHNRRIQGEKYGVYLCRPPKEVQKTCVGFVSASALLVEDVAWRYCCDIIRNPIKLAEAIAAMRTPDPTTPQGTPISERIKELEDEIEATIDLQKSAKTETARKKIKDALRLAEDELEILEREMQVLEGIHKNWSTAQDEIRRFEHWCSLWREKLDDASLPDKKICLEYLGVRIKIFKYGHKPRFHLSAAPPSIMEKIAGAAKNEEFVSPQSPIRLCR